MIKNWPVHMLMIRTLFVIPSSNGINATRLSQAMGNVAMTRWIESPQYSTGQLEGKRENFGYDSVPIDLGGYRMVSHSDASFSRESTIEKYFGSMVPQSPDRKTRE